MNTDLHLLFFLIKLFAISQLNESKKVGYMALEKEKIQENFEEFMFYIDDTLDEIRQKASKQGYHLDMSLESLKDLAQFVRENDVKNNPENIDDFFNSWVYLGEVFRLQAKGAYWTVGTENPKNLNYGLEYLTGYNTIGSEFIPLLILNNFTLSSPDRLNNNFFYELVLKRLNPKPINLDHLPTEEG